MKKKLILSFIICCMGLPALVAQEALPLGWHSTNIGSLDIPGSTEWDPEAELFILESTGDMSPDFRPDNMHLTYVVQTGNFEIVTLVSFLYGMGQMGYGLNPFEEAGVMIREDLSPFSKAYYMSVVGNGGIRYYVRDHEDQDGMKHPGEGSGDIQVPCWLKLKRIGNSFDSYFSLDGKNWVYSQDANRTIEMNPTCYTGLFCRGNANYVELFGWDNPNNDYIRLAISEFEATRVEEIANIYTVQNPILGYFVNIHVENSYLDVSDVFGKLEDDEIIYDTNTSDRNICQSDVLDESDSILIEPKSIGSCTMTLTGEVSSYDLVNKFPVFVWDTPEGWISNDLGLMKTPGFILKEKNLYTMGGSADASSPTLSEGFHFLHKSLEGDAEIVAKISYAAIPTSGGMGGISFRADSTDLDAAMARLVYSGEGKVRFESRTAPGEAVVINAEADVALPYWIRMTKTGTSLEAYLSSDGENWSALGTSLDPELGSTFEAGLTAGSADNEKLSILAFDELRLVNSAPSVLNPIPEQRMAVGQSDIIDVSGVFGHPEGTTPLVTLDNSAPGVVAASIGANQMMSLTALSEGEAIISLHTGSGEDELRSQFPVVVTAALDLDWLFADIGEPLQAGYPASLGEESYSISTSGHEISGSTDEFSYLYKEKTGAYQIVAKVEDIEDRGPDSEAGIMFRESLDPGSLYIEYSLTAYEGIKLQYRWDDHSQPVMEIKDPSIEPPCWIRLQRDEFNYFTAAYSLDGEDWIPHGEFSIPLELPGTAMAGLSSTSGFNEGTSLFSNVDISQFTSLDDKMSQAPLRVDHYPNPFSESATLRIDVSEQTDMQITLYNIAGIQMAELMNERLDPGRHHIVLNAPGLVSGTYYYRVVTPGYVTCNKIIKIRP